MNKATQQNYIKHFGPDAFVPGYCGKCPGADMVDGDPICTVFAEDGAPRILPSRDGCNEPPDWCPIRHISRRPLIVEIEQKQELLRRCLRYFADLNGSAWIKGEDAGSRDMRQRSEALQRLLFETTKVQDDG